MRLLTLCTNKRDFKYWYVAPSYAQCFAEFQAIAHDPVMGGWIKKVRQQPFPQISFVNGSVVGFRSFDRPVNLRGAGLDEVWVDEIQDIEEKHFWPVVRPLISDRRGTLAVSGQFRGKNWFYRQFYEPGQPGPQSKQPLYKSWAFPSRLGLMFQGEEGQRELEIARSQVPKFVWDQEYECIPAGNQNAVFKLDDLERIKSDRIGAHLDGPRPGYVYIVGLDIGRVRDCSAVVVQEVQTNQVVHAQRLPLGMRHEHQAIEVGAIAKRWRAPVVADATGGATGGHVNAETWLRMYAAQCAQFGFHRVVLDPKTKFNLVSQCILDVEQGSPSIPDRFGELRDELATYEGEYINGYWRFHGPDGHRDDLCSAWFLSQHGMHKKFYPQTGGVPHWHGRY